MSESLLAYTITDQLPESGSDAVFGGKYRRENSQLGFFGQLCRAANRPGISLVKGHLRSRRDESERVHGSNNRLRA